MTAQSVVMVPPAPPASIVGGMASTVQWPFELVISVVGVNASVVELAVCLTTDKAVQRVDHDGQLRLRRSVVHQPTGLGVDLLATVCIVAEVSSASGQQLRLCWVLHIVDISGVPSMADLLDFLKLRCLLITGLQGEGRGSS